MLAAVAAVAEGTEAYVDIFTNMNILCFFSVRIIVHVQPSFALSSKSTGSMYLTSTLSGQQSVGRAQTLDCINERINAYMKGVPNGIAYMPPFDHYVVRKNQKYDAEIYRAGR